MNKKGYTLIELIGVIVVLSLMVLLVANISDKAVKEAKTKASKQCEENTIMAAENWALDNKEKIENEKILKIDDLIQEGYLDNKDCLKNKCIKITENKEGTKTVYNYSLEKEC